MLSRKAVKLNADSSSINLCHPFLDCFYMHVCVYVHMHICLILFSTLSPSSLLVLYLPTALQHLLSLVSFL